MLIMIPYFYHLRLFLSFTFNSAHTPGNASTTHCWSQSNGSHSNGPLSNGPHSNGSTVSPSQLHGQSLPKRRRHNAHSPTVNLSGYHPTSNSSSSGSGSGYSNRPTTMDTSMEVTSPVVGKGGMMSGRTPLKAHKVSVSCCLFIIFC